MNNASRSFLQSASSVKSPDCVAETLLHSILLVSIPKSGP